MEHRDFDRRGPPPGGNFDRRGPPPGDNFERRGPPLDGPRRDGRPEPYADRERDRELYADRRRRRSESPDRRGSGGFDRGDNGNGAKRPRDDSDRGSTRGEDGGLGRDTGSPGRSEVHSQQGGLKLPPDLEGLEHEALVQGLLEQNEKLRNLYVETESKLQQLAEAQKAVNQTKLLLAEQELKLAKLSASVVADV